ncbi:hypothetical protein FAZ69_15425 [Trinickia terrae]|uniref:Uncharacterized protein n=1 Tax=Trinickia terrae TaxID=2571161 RepID=A0A4U1I3B0_9BURK|nr:hypothetical protein [Trinickia terrae]TKC87682.1 hypothetical protein FAZ69_15425 [Trinickia terrae]
MTDPSEYIAQHLRNFSASSSDHPASGVLNPYALLLPIVLFVVLVCIAAFEDRWAMFRLAPPMSFRRRLFVWWSCAWRQFLASIPLAVIGGVAFLYLVHRLAVPLGHLSGNMLQHATGMFTAMLSLVVTAMPLIVAPLICTMLSLPVYGYMVRKGLASHALAVPARFGLWRATRLGVTTLAWSGVGTLFIADLTATLPHRVAEGLRLLFFVVWGMYIVLPRQIRRAERLRQVLSAK